MKIVLQQIASRRIYAGSGLWVTELNESLSFYSTDEAIDFAIHEKLFGVQVLVHMDSAHLDFAVPCCIMVSSLKPCEV